MFSPFNRPVHWTALAAAITFGVVEWLALARSRAADQLARWRAIGPQR